MAFERPESEAPSNLNRFQERTEDAASRARSVPLRMITELVFRFLSEDEPSNARRSVVDLGWPGWRERFESRGGRKGPSTAACREALVKYMPGIEPLVDSLVDAAGGDEEMIPAARMVRIGWLEGLTQAWDFVSPPPPMPIRARYRKGSSRAFRREAAGTPTERGGRREPAGLRASAFAVGTGYGVSLEEAAPASRNGGTRE